MSSTILGFDNWIEPGRVASESVSTEDASYPVSNVYDLSRRAKVWRSTSVSSQYFLWDLGFSSNPKIFAMGGPKNRSLKITPSATIKLMGNETDSWGAPSFSHTFTWEDELYALMDSDGLHTEALRYWKLTIDDPLNPLLYLELGWIYLGDGYSSVRGSAQYPLDVQHQDLSSTLISEYGTVYADQRNKTESLSVDWFALTNSEKQDLESIFRTFGIHKPIPIVFDKDQVFSTDAVSRTKLCRFVEPPTFRLIAPGVWSASTRFREDL